MNFDAIFQQFITFVIGVLASIGIPTDNFRPTTTVKPPPIQCQDGFSGQNCQIECGLNFFKPNVSSLKIVGGSFANPNSWPSHVLIKFNYVNDYYIESENVTVRVPVSTNCGGTLIDPMVVLTSASCIQTLVTFEYDEDTYSAPVELTSKYPTFESMYTVYLGMHNLTYSEAPYNLGNIAPTIKKAVRKIIKNEKYDENNYLNDIAILKLDSPVTLNNYIQIACLPSNKTLSFPSFNQTGYIVGWGTVEETQDNPPVLKNAKITVYNSSACDSTISEVTKNYTTQICAGDLAGKTGDCYEDEGGGMYVLDTVGGNQKYVLAGITSYSEGCATPKKASLFTRTVAFLDWIKLNLVDPL